MKKLLHTLLLFPFLVASQATTPYAVIENGMITAQPDKIAQFEAGMAAHNKKYHAEGLYGARVYGISSGPNVGKYMWVMGPLPWSAFDGRPALEGHDEDWAKNVLAYSMADGDQTYWKFHAALSNFSNDFDLKHLSVMMIDIAPFKDMQFFGLLEKVSKVMKTKHPDQTFGMYTNEMPSDKDGRDFAYVDFFDNMGWMGREDTFMKDYEEVHGAGSYASFIEELQASTRGIQTELWDFRGDLSGLGPQVIAATRQ